jgi:predicted transport protein
MKLFTIKGNKLNNVSGRDFKLEKDIQNIVENNLEGLFNLQFVKSEMTIKNFRVDTLAFDPENRSFIIIEFKKGRNYSVIDQGYTYMSLLLNNKSDFILEYNENCGGQLKRDDVDWSQSKVIFISPSFTDYQKHSVNFKDVPFELWEIKQYENNLIGFVQHKTTSDESIATTIIGQEENIVRSVSQEVRINKEEDHINHKKVTESTKQLYADIKERILNIGPDIEIIPRKMYIGYKRKNNFFSIYIGKNELWCWINLKKGDLDDPKGICRDVSNIGHYGPGDYDLTIKIDSDLDYVMFLINQSYKRQE